MEKKSFDFKNSSFAEMAEFFHKNGYIIINKAINEETVKKLREELQKEETKQRNQKAKNKNGHKMHVCFFENSKTTVDIIENSKIADFADYVIKDIPNVKKTSPSMKSHVIHNNAFIVPGDGRGEAPFWHVDDPVQQISLPNNYILPEEVKLPVLVATYMIWLSDCETPENGPTYVVPGSHRFGRNVDPELASSLGIPMCGKAGTAVLINANTWHRGCNNISKKPRETLQITFARRIIGHKFKTIMNYNMPEHVLFNRSKTAFERLGFLQGGAYS